MDGSSLQSFSPDTTLLCSPSEKSSIFGYLLKRWSATLPTVEVPVPPVPPRLGIQEEERICHHLLQPTHPYNRMDNDGGYCRRSRHGTFHAAAAADDGMRERFTMSL